MPGIHTKADPLIARKTPFPPGAGDAARAIRNWKFPGVEQIAVGFENLSKSLEQLHSAARQHEPELHELVVTDGTTGRVIASLGEYEVNGIKTSGGYFSELYAGDPYGDSDPAHAILKVTRDGKVQVGENGWIDVLDPYADSAAWIGTQFDTLPVTGAVSNGGLIRLTVTAHTLATGDIVRVLDVGGVPNATGIFTVTSINANTIDLQNSVFVGTYTSGGTVDRLMHITGAANNGSGLIRITQTAHGYESGDKVNVQNVGGVPNATGQWIIDVITANTYDLVDSTWGGGYTSGGTALRYFAGGLFQTIAIGPSFPDYRLRAFANGDLRIRNAQIELSSANGEIVLDPTVPSIVLTSDDDSNATITLDANAGTITVAAADGTGSETTIYTGGITIESLDEPGTESLYDSGFVHLVGQQITTITSGGMLRLDGYSQDFGPLILFRQAQGTVASPSATLTDDNLGGIVGFGYDGSPESVRPVSIRMLATQTHSGAGHGTKIIFEVTTNASTSPIEGMVLENDGTLDVANGYKIGGVNGINLTASFGMSVTVNTDPTAIHGTPGAGQTQFTAVTGVTLNTTSRTFTGGILTA